MVFKAVLFLFTTLLVVTTRVSCHDDELSEAPTHPPHQHHHLKQPSHGPHHAHPPVTYAYPPKAHAHPPHHEHHHHHHHVNEPSQAPHHAHPPTHAQPPHYHHVPPVEAPTFAPLPPLESHDCTLVCFERCNSGKGKRECERTCTRCCKQCLCVPPGPRGTNLEKCGKCYSKVTHHNQIYVCP